MRLSLIRLTAPARAGIIELFEPTKSVDSGGSSIMMHVAISAAAALVAGAALALGADGRSDTPPAKGKDLSIHHFTMNSIDGEEVSLAKYRDQVCLIVNVASR